MSVLHCSYTCCNDDIYTKPISTQLTTVKSVTKLLSTICSNTCFNMWITIYDCHSDYQNISKIRMCCLHCLIWLSIFELIIIIIIMLVIMLLLAYARCGVHWCLCKLVCNVLAPMPYWWCSSKSTCLGYAGSRAWLAVSMAKRIHWDRQS